GGTNHRGQFLCIKWLAQEQEVWIELKLAIDEVFIVTAGKDETGRGLALSELVIDLAAAKLRQNGIEQHHVDLIRPAFENFDRFLTVSRGKDSVAELRQDFHH